MKNYFRPLTVLPVFLLLSVAIISSCLSEHSGKPRSSGKTSIILIVTNNKSQWEGSIGEQIRDYFGQEMIGLPQPEATFLFYNIPYKNLDKVYKKFHNIFIVDINPEFKKTLVETKEDLWSWPQRVIKITAPTEEAFAEKFGEQKQAYMRLFDELERERIIISFEMANDLDISNLVEKTFQFYLGVPGGFSIAEKEKGFIWLRHTVTKVKQDVELGIMIYSSPYKDTLDFSPDSIISRRNEMTKKFVHGPTIGSYMKVADSFVKPVFQLADDFIVDYTVETRGLWDLKNDFMGGPFLSYTFVDEKNNLLITLDGYVYFPNGRKTKYIRQLDGIFHTLRMVN